MRKPTASSRWSGIFDALGFGRKNRKGANPSKRQTLSFEPLEERTLLSVSPGGSVKWPMSPGFIGPPPPAYANADQTRSLWPLPTNGADGPQAPWAASPISGNNRTSLNSQSSQNSLNSESLQTSDGPPYLAISGSGSINEGVPYTLHLSATGDGAGNITSWTVDWGDTSSNTYNAADIPANGNVMHMYAFQTDGPQNYTITATATDGTNTYSAVALDATFGANGTSTITGIGDGSWTIGTAIQPDGQIVVAASDYSLVRFNPDGTQDMSFGTTAWLARTLREEPPPAWRSIRTPARSSWRAPTARLLWSVTVPTAHAKA